MKFQSCCALFQGTKKQKNKKKKEKAAKATLAVEVNFTDDKDKHLLNEHSIPDSPTRYRLHLYPLSLSLLLQLFDVCVCLNNIILFTGISQYQQTFTKKFRRLRILMKVNLCNMYMIKSQKIYFRKYYLYIFITTKLQKRSWSNKCRDILGIIKVLMVSFVKIYHSWII